MDNFLFGFYSIQSALKVRPESILSLQISVKKTQSYILDDLLQSLNAYQIPLTYVKPESLDKLTNHARHQGVVAKIKKFTTGNEHTLIEHLKTLTHPALILVLENVQDPRNFGACMRSAAAAEVDGIIFPKGACSPITPLVHHASVGSSYYLNLFQVSNLARTIELLKKSNIWCYALDVNSEQTLYQTDLTLGSAIIMGSEGNGLKYRTKKLCDATLFIPMGSLVQSLNVSVASAISLFEARRQRKMIV